MKKVLSVLLAVLMLLALVSCGEKSADADKASEAEDATQQTAPESAGTVVKGTEELHRSEFEKILAANTIEALFAKYDSYVLNWNWPEENYTCLTYQTKDCVFHDRGISLDYSTDLYVYCQDMGVSTDGPSVWCVLDMTGDPLKYDRFVPDTFEAFCNTAYEYLDSIETKDGVICFHDVYTEEGSALAIADLTGRKDLSGWTLFSDLYCDAETYEALELVQTMVKDGESKVLFRLTAAFDQPEPAASAALREPFERQSEKMMTVTVYKDHGTDHELVNSIRLPQNTECSYSVDTSIPTIYFNDPYYTTLYHWDRQSDLTIYLVTNPDEDMMARYNSLLEYLKANG